jgi:hypothetical protein
MMQKPLCALLPGTPAWCGLAGESPCACMVVVIACMGVVIACTGVVIACPGVVIACICIVGGKV